jgi:hypothetical protein
LGALGSLRPHDQSQPTAPFGQARRSAAEIFICRPLFCPTPIVEHVGEVRHFPRAHPKATESCAEYGCCPSLRVAILGERQGCQLVFELLPSVLRPVLQLGEQVQERCPQVRCGGPGCVLVERAIEDAAVLVLDLLLWDGMLREGVDKRCEFVT